MKSLLRFVLMISLVVIGKLNTTPAESAKFSQASEQQWIIPVYTTSLHNQSANTAAPLVSESGKFRSWRTLRTATDTDE